MSERDIAKQFDLERGMLWGDRLRVLLNSSHISYGEINELLREKGIFIDSSDKAVIVPLLSSCLLTPEEFGRLVSRSYTRESLEKYKTDKLTLSSKDADWRSSILENFEEVVGGISPESGHEFVHAPSIVSKSKDEIEIHYEIKKEDFSKDWIDRELHFSGVVTISRRNGELLLELQKTHTSRETDRINSIFVKSLSNHWKSKGVIQEHAPKSIKFEDFDNQERIRFFLHLTGADTAALRFNELSDIEIIRDEAAGALPDDPSIKWMDGKVRSIRINGEKLNQLGLVTNEAFHKYCFLVKMSASYQFQSGATKGKCTVIFSFGGRTSHERDYANTELNICIERIPRLESNTEKDVRRNILRNLCDLRDAAMQKIVAKRTNDGSR